MANMKEIEALTDAFGPNGFEDEVIREVKDQCGDLGVADGAMHNVYTTMEKKKARHPMLVLDAHLDEYGFMVQPILEDGLSNILMLGGFHPTNLPAHFVIVRTRDGKEHRGITTFKPVHFPTAAQKNDNPLAIKDILVDVSTSGWEEVTGVYRIRPGDPIMPDVSSEYYRESGALHGKALNNYLGCVNVIDTMQAFRDEMDRLAVEVVGTSAAQEEVGTRGAAVTAQQVQSDLAIVPEGSPANGFCFHVGTTQECLRSDVQIRHMDNSYISNMEFIHFAQEIGDKLGIKYQDTTRRGGSTNAERISPTGEMVLVLVLGIPSRYVHNHHNFHAEEDMNITIRMAVEVIRGLDKERIMRILRKGVI